MWARSNIYWDVNDKKLTFVPGGSDVSKEGYQGVFFRWGSLVGISPVGDFDADTPVYVPDEDDDDNNPDTKWKASTAEDEGYTTWGALSGADTDIPYVDPVHFHEGPTVDGNTYLIDAARNDPATMYAYRRGDICQYLGTVDDNLKGYRLPRGSEFGQRLALWNDHTDGWVLVGTFTAQTGNDYGTAIFTGSPAVQGYPKNTIMGNAIFPASGSRSTYDGTPLDNAGTSGSYWSGSANGLNSVWCFGIALAAVGTGNTAHRSNGFPVRCVKN
jgi:hypothetical protein